MRTRLPINDKRTDIWVTARVLNPRRLLETVASDLIVRIQSYRYPLSRANFSKPTIE
jgi:hypothetical protein